MIDPQQLRTLAEGLAADAEGLEASADALTALAASMTPDEGAHAVLHRAGWIRRYTCGLRESAQTLLALAEGAKVVR